MSTTSGSGTTASLRVLTNALLEFAARRGTSWGSVHFRVTRAAGGVAVPGCQACEGDQVGHPGPDAGQQAVGRQEAATGHKLPAHLHQGRQLERDRKSTHLNST